MLTVERFKAFSKFLSVLSKLLAVLILSVLVIGSFNLFIRQNFAAFSLDQTGAFSILLSDVVVKQADYDWAFSIVLPIILAFLGYIFFKASYLFDYLAEGKTPFSYDFAQSVKVLGLLLVFFDLATSLLYIFLINFVVKEGVFLYFSVSSFFFIGLILYLASGVLNYGINLQVLSDVTNKKKDDESTEE